MNKGIHSKPNKKAGILYISLIVFIGLMIFSGFKIVMWFIENNQSKEIIQEIANNIVINENAELKDKYEIDFEGLKSKNENTVAWLKVNGTNIEFPVVQASDNNFYLNHSFDKSPNGAGWIFADYKNKLNGTDKNMVIYGHNRRDGSMFGTLKNVLNEEWYNNEDNLKVLLITQEEKSEYQVFSVYKTEVEEYYITTEFANNEEFGDFVKDIKGRSITNFKTNVTKDDRILTLSTCADNNKYRVVLHAQKVEDEQM